MRRIMLALLIIGVLSVAMPLSAKTDTPEQSTLPIPLGFCVRFSVPVGDFQLVDSFIGGSIWFNQLYYVVLVNGGMNEGDILEVTVFVPTDTVFDIFSYDSTNPSGLIFEGLGANFATFGGANLQIITGEACSFQVYDDNAALAQTYMVPNKGFDVYQIFPVDGVSEGILSFTVSIDDISGASAGDVLGSNEAGNIYFTYNGGGTCSVTYPYPDGKTNSKSFTCWK